MPVTRRCPHCDRNLDLPPGYAPDDPVSPLTLDEQHADDVRHLVERAKTIAAGAPNCAPIITELYIALLNAEDRANRKG